MRNILRKELTLSASALTYLFILFGFLFLVPGYPILCSAFFVTLGIFYSFQAAREANDIVFSALLPVAKRDVVKGKYAFVCLIEGCAFLLMAAATMVRMAGFGEAVYRTNALMNANLFALGGALTIFGLFNLVFLAGFFKTAYRYGRPFVAFIIVCFIVIGAMESLHHIPGLEALNAFGTAHLPLQAGALGAGAILYGLMTVLSYRIACRRFEIVDL